MFQYIIIKVSNYSILRYSCRILILDNNYDGNKIIDIIFDRDPMHGTPLSVHASWSTCIIL